MKIVIIGNGVAGITAARYIRKYSDHEVLVISSESEFFFSRTALMYVYMGHMHFEDIQPYEADFWSKNNISLLHDHVTQVDFSKRQLILEKSESDINYDRLILATGSRPNFYGWKGQDLKGVQGLYSRQDLQLMEENTKDCKRAVVIGGGLIGIEMTEMLLSRGINVDFLVRENFFWSSVLPQEDSLLLMEHFKKHHGLTMHYGEEIEEFIGEHHIEKILTKKGTIIETDFAGVTVGVSANLTCLKNIEIEYNRGILVDDYLKTSIENVYAIGDCAELRNAQYGRRNIEQVWYTARMMGETVAKTICGKETKYLPGHWFNSAKFFDVEYQTYGVVKPILEENQTRFVWKHQQKELLLDFVFETASRKLIGVNSFGIRLRHELFDAWLKQQRSIEFVLENLKTANFDPEFYQSHENSIITQFNQEYGTSITPGEKKWWRTLLTSN